MRLQEHPFLHICYALLHAMYSCNDEHFKPTRISTSAKRCNHHPKSTPLPPPRSPLMNGATWVVTERRQVPVLAVSDAALLRTSYRRSPAQIPVFRHIWDTVALTEHVHGMRQEGKTRGAIIQYSQKDEPLTSSCTRQDLGQRVLHVHTHTYVRAMPKARLR